MRVRYVPLKTWYEAVSKFIIPSLRALIAEVLIKKYGYTQVKASEALGVTQPAISNYLSGKRGRKGLEVLRSDETVMKAVERIAYCIHKNALGCVNDALDSLLLYIKSNPKILENLLSREYRDMIKYWAKK